MNTPVINASMQRRRQQGWLVELHRRHAAWTSSAIVLCILAICCVVLMAIDTRTLNDVSVWMKPLKFCLSLAIYFATLACFVPLLPQGLFQHWEGRLVTWVTLVAGAFEIAYITVQAALGEASHFNVSTPFHARMYSLMGIGATLLVLAPLWMGIRILWHHGLRDPYVLAVGIGLVLTFALGGTFGVYLGGQSGHWVGATASDAGGVPLFNWSRDGGDLRVAHFFGMHAMQILPILTYLLPASLSLAKVRTIVVLGSASYAGLSVFTFVQAINGQPFLP